MLDPQSLCPVSGPQGVTVVLVDTSDDLPETTRREVLGQLDDMITTLPPFFRLDIRVLDIAGVRSRSLFSRCNPGDGAGLSEWTDNPRIARLRWIEDFRKPAAACREKQHCLREGCELADHGRDPGHRDRSILRLRPPRMREKRCISFPT